MSVTGLSVLYDGVVVMLSICEKSQRKLLVSCALDQRYFVVLFKDTLVHALLVVLEN